LKLLPYELDQFERERQDYRDLVEPIRRGRRAFGLPGLELTCIGNAGGVDNIVHGRPCGGFLLRYAGRSLIVDPGSNSLSYLASHDFNPYQITDVLASHAHNDHVGDLCSAVSAALNLGLGVPPDGKILVCPSLVDYSNSSSTKYGFMLPAYAWNGDVRAMYWSPLEVRRFDGAVIRAESKVTVGDDIVITAARGKHGHVSATGFLIETPLGRIGYTSDTEYFSGLTDWYKDVDLLWMNMNTLGLEATHDARIGCGGPVRNHLGYAGVCSLLEKVRPRFAVVSHLGAQLLDRRDTVQAMLSERFAELDVLVHCAVNGDSYIFEHNLGEVPQCRKFTP
jgi:ribonuclease BN (tRNA processing enzyme)